MAGRGKKLSDAYVELRADDSKLSGDVKVKARRIGKEFGGQLNNALHALNLDPIDVKANPKAALAAIETTRQRLRDMSRDADSVEMRVRTERALAQLDRFRRQLGAVDDEPVKVEADTSPAKRQVEQLRRQLIALGLDPINVNADPKAALADIKRVDAELTKLSRESATVHVRVDAESARTALARLRQQIGDAGDDSARGFGARFGARLGPLLADVPGMAIAGTAIGLAIAPTAAAALAAGVIGGAAGGGIIGGVILASRDQRVKDAGAALGKFVLGDLADRAGDFVPVMLRGIARIRAAWSDLGPDLDRIFASSRFVDPLVAGAVSGARHLIHGIADAVDHAEPVVAAFGAGLDRIGAAAGDAFTLLSGDSREAASAITDLTVLVSNLIRVTAGLVHAGAVVKGWTDSLDVAIDRGRYWIEDNSYLAKQLQHVGVQLDLTADGFDKGSAAGEAYRKATLGTATAADFATLKTAGMTDAQITAADASGTFRQKTDEVNAALGNTAPAAAGATQELRNLSVILNEIIGRTLGSEEAQIRLESAIDAASDAAKRNGDGIDANVPKQRANREALLAIAAASQDAAAKIFEETSSQEAASAASERGRAKFLEIAHSMGVSSTEAISLANKLFAIPNVDRTVAVNNQQALAAIAAVQADLRGLHNKNITVGVYYKSNGDLKLPGGTSLKGARWGGVWEHAASGVVRLRQAGMYSAVAPAQYAIAEPGTGGEAFIPRRGDPDRSLQILQQAASWIGAMVLPGGDGGRSQQPVAMDTGGVRMPGWSPPVYTGAGAALVTDRVVRRLDRLAALIGRLAALIGDDLIDAVERVAPGVGFEINGVGATLRVRGRTR